MAVYTQLDRQDIESFLAQYDIGELQSFEGIAEGVENTNYLIEVSALSHRERGGASRGEGAYFALKSPHPNPLPEGEGIDKYVLTLFEKRVSIESLPYFNALMEWWHAHAIPCPCPIKKKDGRALSVLKERPALLVNFLEGSGARKITVPHMLQLGELAAKMHITGMDFPHTRPNSMSLPAWESIVDAIQDRAEEITPGLRRTLSEEYNYLSEHWPEGLPGGPIHADLFPDNVFFNKSFGGAPTLSGVIDFYFACNDFWAYDLAICVNAWCFDERHRFVPERLEALMHAYNESRPMTSEEEAAFPILLRGAALRFLLTRSYDWLNTPKDALVNPKDPIEYMAKLSYWKNTVSTA